MVYVKSFLRVCIKNKFSAVHFSTYLLHLVSGEAYVTVNIKTLGMLRKNADGR